MAQDLVLYMKCVQCGGDGQFEIGSGTFQQTVPCNWPGCVNGFIACAELRLDPGLDDLYNKINDVMNKCNDIFEQLTE